MDEIVILYDNQKRVKSLFLAIFLILFSLAILYFMIFITHRISLNVTAGMLGISLYMIVLIFQIIKKMRSKEPVGLILNSEVCDFKDSPIGKIKWCDVYSLDTRKIGGTKYILLKLKDPHKFIKNISKVRQNFIVKNGVGISSDELAIDFSELKNLIEKYFNLYNNDSL